MTTFLLMGSSSRKGRASSRPSKKQLEAGREAFRRHVVVTSLLTIGSLLFLGFLIVSGREIFTDSTDWSYNPSGYRRGPMRGGPEWVVMCGLVLFVVTVARWVDLVKRIRKRKGVGERTLRD